MATITKNTKPTKLIVGMQKWGHINWEEIANKTASDIFKELKEALSKSIYVAHSAVMQELLLDNDLDSPPSARKFWEIGTGGVVSMANDAPVLYEDPIRREFAEIEVLGNNFKFWKFVFVGTRAEAEAFTKNLEDTIKPILKRLHICNQVSAEKVENMIDIKPFIISADGNLIDTKEERDALEIFVQFDKKGQPMYYIFEDGEQIKEVQVALLKKGRLE